MDEVMKALLKSAVQFLYPAYCAYCNQPAPASMLVLCPRCWNSLIPCTPMHVHSLNSCAQIQACSTIDDYYSLWTFTQHTQVLVHHLKYRRTTRLAPVLGEKMAPLLQAASYKHPIDCLIPVPLYWRRQLWRGYNQSELLSRALAEAIGVPVCTGALKRVRNTKSQTQLSLEERQENVHRAFAVKKPTVVSNKSIALVDDVLTTGATANACARVLVEAGAKHVVALSLIRA